MKNLHLLVAFLFAFHSLSLHAQQAPALDHIKKEELKEDLFYLASDEMRGRRAGTLDELKAAVWMAKRANEAGLEPAGDDGTYFQFFDLHRKVVDPKSELSLSGKKLELWKDVWQVTPLPTRIDDEIVWLNSYKDTIENISNKIVAMKLMPPSKIPEEGMSLWVYRYALSALREQSTILKEKGAKAVLLVADSTASSQIGFFGHGLEEGKYSLISEIENDSIGVFLLAEKFEKILQEENVNFKADVQVNEFTYPSANVIAKAPGTAAQLKNEYVLFSAHHDHDGIGESVDNDSIWNGADDNASVSVAILAIGRAWVKKPGKRSALFVWHGAEERGLMGSRHFAENATVEKNNIIAVLNGDMIGRNENGKAALLGSIAPHRNSVDLVEMAMKANEEITHFEVDTSWDEESHPEFWYFRSDHLPYARTNIPSIFFTTLLHPDYHTPDDEAEDIDLDKLTKMTKWMYATGWKISENIEKPRLEK
ncbi:M28 family peptidase [Gramella sp. AN32]|uniref:M28 family peptidase n=1 Tax=Christiangramia antarctica TaxID=2058158 RepID=A0ABW5X491_9FLAO|nr:M28 family peptidase [Gramella sp. AN32]MCM4157645.1 peptidase M28 [Gramella sp. AN32]